MPQLTAGGNSVAHQLLELLDIGKSLHRFAIPDQGRVTADFEDASSTWDQRDFANLFTESGKQFLCEPSGAEHPLALSTVMNFYSRSRHDVLGGRFIHRTTSSSVGYLRFWNGQLQKISSLRIDDLYCGRFVI